MEKNLALEALVELTNNNFGYVPSTPAEFNELSRLIQKKTGRPLSVATIKRIWGYVSYKGFPSVTTLNILAKYNEYSDWESFFNKSKSAGLEDSGFMEESMINSDELNPGDRLLLHWGKEKSCELECIGGKRFRVAESANIKLQQEDVLTLHTLCVGHPVYVSDIERGEERIPAYLGAKKGGLVSLTVKKG